MSMHDAALLLLGHGSTVNADSSAPTYEQAEELRRRHLFAEIHVAFWKEEPNFRQALRQSGRRRIYVVPNFISSGYFTEQIIPRELGLTGALTLRGEQEIVYCDPVGLHPSMTEALVQRAQQVVSQSGSIIEDPSQSACLFICGHGTSFNDNSTKIIHEQARLIRTRGIYADCQAVLMEQIPFVKDWRTLTPCPDVVVVPFFIADGLHSFEDIPVLLGLTHNVKEKSFLNPHQELGRRLWYATAIGSEKFLADVIVAQVQQAVEGVSLRLDPIERPEESSELRKILRDLMRSVPPPLKMGQIIVLPDFQLRHENDAGRDLSDLLLVRTLEDLREWMRLDAEGNFRPLRAAPNLRSGWVYQAARLEDVHAALDYLYPAGLANWMLWRSNALPVTPWLETAARQSGRFKIVAALPPSALENLVKAICDRGCLKKRLWAPAQQKIENGAHELVLLCPEACNYWIGKAREKLKDSVDD